MDDQDDDNDVIIIEDEDSDVDIIDLTEKGELEDVESEDEDSDDLYGAETFIGTKEDNIKQDNALYDLDEFSLDNDVGFTEALLVSKRLDEKTVSAEQQLAATSSSIKCDECMLCHSQDGIPKLLPCGHVACLGCLVTKMATRCPSCRASVPVQPYALPVSLPVLHQWHPTIAHRAHKLHTCNKCSSGQAQTEYCKGCDSFMCLTCAHDHPKEELCLDQKPIARYLAICAHHYQQTEYFCLKCMKRLCIHCIYRLTCVYCHSKVTTLKRLEQEKYLDLERMTAKVVNTLNCYNRESLASLISELDKEKLAIEEHFQVIRKQLQLRKNKLFYCIDLLHTWSKYRQLNLRPTFQPEMSMRYGHFIMFERTCANKMSKDMFDVTTTSKGDIVYTDKREKTVTRLNIKQDFQAQFCGLEDPSGIVYDPHRDLIYVCDSAKGVVIFLEPLLLSEKSRIRTPGISRPTGISILSTGDLVVTQSATLSEGGKIGIYSRYGVAKSTWTRYKANRLVHKLCYNNFKNPRYITVGKEDYLYVSDNSAILKLYVKDDELHLQYEYKPMKESTSGLAGLSLWKNMMFVTVQYSSEKTSSVLAKNVENESSDCSENWICVEQWPQWTFSATAVCTVLDQLVVMGYYGVKLYNIHTSSSLVSDYAYSNLHRADQLQHHNNLLHILKKDITAHEVTLETALYDRKNSLLESVNIFQFACQSQSTSSQHETRALLASLLNECDHAHDSRLLENVIAAVEKLEAAVSKTLPVIASGGIELSGRVRFSCENSIDIGKFQDVCLLWQKKNMESHLWDATFTSSGCLAVTDRGKKKVLLISTDGRVKADSAKIRVNFQTPEAITYYSPANALVVCDRLARELVFMDPKTLYQVSRHELEGITSPVAVSVLGELLLVTEYDEELQLVRVVLFDKSLKQESKWTLHCNLKCPHFVTVTNPHILIANENYLVTLEYVGGIISHVETKPLDGKCRGLAACSMDVFVALGSRLDIDSPEKVVAVGSHPAVNNTRALTRMVALPRKDTGDLNSIAVTESDSEKDFLVILRQTGIQLYSLTTKPLPADASDRTKHLETNAKAIQHGTGIPRTLCLHTDLFQASKWTPNAHGRENMKSGNNSSEQYPVPGAGPGNDTQSTSNFDVQYHAIGTGTVRENAESDDTSDEHCPDADGTNTESDGNPDELCSSKRTHTDRKNTNTDGNSEEQYPSTWTGTDRKTTDTDDNFNDQCPATLIWTGTDRKNTDSDSSSDEEYPSQNQIKLSQLYQQSQPSVINQKGRIKLTLKNKRNSLSSEKDSFCAEGVTKDNESGEPHVKEAKIKMR